MHINLIYLASGQGRRFGRNKLLTPFAGRPLYQHGFLQLAGAMKYVHEAGISCDLAVVSPYETLRLWCRGQGALAWPNDASKEGIAASIRIGTAALDGDAYGFFVADRPLLQARTIARFLLGYVRSGQSVGAMRASGVVGNPAVFCSTFCQELMSLRGDRGAGALLKKYREQCWLYDVPSIELADIDTEADARYLLPLMNKK